MSDRQCPSCFILHLPSACPSVTISALRVAPTIPPTPPVAPTEPQVLFRGENLIDTSQPPFQEEPSLLFGMPGATPLNQEVLKALTEVLGKNPAFAQQALQKRSPLVKNIPQPKKRRRWPLSIGPDEILPGQTRTLQTQPKVVFRGEKIVCTGQVDDLFLTGFFIGEKPQLPKLWMHREEQHGLNKNCRPLHEFFTDCAVLEAQRNDLHDYMFMDTCDAALMITLQIENRGKVPRMFATTIIGTAVLS